MFQMKLLQKWQLKILFQQIIVLKYRHRELTEF